MAVVEGIISPGLSNRHTAVVAVTAVPLSVRFCVCRSLDRLVGGCFGLNRGRYLLVRRHLGSSWIDEDLHRTQPASEPASACLPIPRVLS